MKNTVQDSVLEIASWTVFLTFLSNAPSPSGFGSGLAVVMVKLEPGKFVRASIGMYAA